MFDNEEDKKNNDNNFFEAESNYSDEELNNESHFDEPELFQNEEDNISVESDFNNTHLVEEVFEKDNEDNQFDYGSSKGTYYKETVKAKKESGFKKFIVACVIVSLFGGAGIGTSYAVMEKLLFNEPLSNKGEALETEDDKEQIAQAKKISHDEYLSAVDVIDKTFPSVVNINMGVKGTRNYYGFSVPYEGTGSGSGVIFNTDEKYIYIVTNNHVVANTTEISVSITGNENIPASIVGTEASSDIAVIKALRADFEAAGINDIVAAKFGDSDSLKVGQSVIAIGNALGEGKSATGGMVSNLNKSIEIDGLKLDVIQTSSPINPGNSGGALVDYDGEIIGINTAKTSTTVAEGMGYAIPSNTVKEIMERLLSEGTTPKPYLGIMGSDITDDISQMYKLPVGVLVRQIIAGSGAEKAGIKEGDIIISFGDKPIMNMDGLISTLKEQKIGTKVEMGIIRDGDKSMEIDVEILDVNNIQE